LFVKVSASCLLKRDTPRKVYGIGAAGIYIHPTARTTLIEGKAPVLNRE
jgi:hypothetical protein